MIIPPHPRSGGASKTYLRSLSLVATAGGVAAALFLLLGATLAGATLALAPQRAPALGNPLGGQAASLVAPGQAPELQASAPVTAIPTSVPPADGTPPDQTPDSQAIPAFNRAPLVQTGVPLVLQWFSPDSDPTTSIAWGDVDNDGDLDLAVGNLGRPLRVYANTGGALDTDRALWVSAGQDLTTNIAWGDMDGDGDLDLVAGSRSNCSVALLCTRGKIKIYANEDGRLSSATWKELNTTAAIEAIALADADGDADLDIAVGTPSGGQLYLHDTQAGQFVRQALSASQAVASVSWADYDADGRLDLAVGGGPAAASAPGRRRVVSPAAAGPGKIQVYRNTEGAGGLPVFDLAAELPLTAPVRSLVWADLAGDARPDLLVGSARGGIQLVENRTAASPAQPFAPAWLSALPAGDVAALAAGDIDDDGDLDVAAGSTCPTGAASNCPVTIYRTEAEGGRRRLNPDPFWTSGEDVAAYGLAWGDVDGDGDLDLAVGVGGDLGQANRLYRNTRPVLSEATPWRAANAGAVTSLAWGDMDADGGLDLAAGYGGDCTTAGGRAQCAGAGGVRIYAAGDGGLSTSSLWQSDEPSSVQAVAWGDVDGDGSLELAAGAQPACVSARDPGTCRDGGLRLYARSAQGSDHFAPQPIWSADLTDTVQSIAWGDMNGDGLLDLAVGKQGKPSAVYLGDGQALGRTPAWTSQPISTTAGVISDTTSVAWGDVDDDGDLDLALGNRNAPNELYLNYGGVLESQPSWQADQLDLTTSVAWGDVDGDGDLDLAVGNEAAGTRLYRNDRGRLTRNFVWSSLESGRTRSVAWSDFDGDGDLDLAVADRTALRVYQNDQGVLSGNAIWVAEGCCGQSPAIWGDMGRDGDPDLVAAGAVFENQRNDRLRRAGVPIVAPDQPGGGAGADFYASPVVSAAPTVSVTYSLSQPAGVPAIVHARFSLNGGGSWQADPTSTGELQSGNAQTFVWDVAANRLMGRSDNVVLRLLASPALSPQPNQPAGPYQYGASSATTLPFSVRGTQIQVLSDATGGPVAGALVFRLPQSESAGAEPLGNAEGPFVTDAGGYLQGRGTVGIGDTLYALWPVSATLPVSLPWFSYAVYHTSYTPTVSSLEGFAVTQPGKQSLVVQRDNPLVLFNVLMSTEWDPRNDGTFVDDLKAAVKRSSEALFDATNGQMALGNVTVFPNKQNWLQSDVVMYANNGIRPRATQGGAVITPTADIDLAGQPIALAYLPGQVRVGPNWDAYGERGPDLQQDWWRALAHEFGHYFLFLTDDYLGVDKARGLVVGVDCQGSFMTNAYDDTYSEFLDFGNLPPADWPGDCKATLAANTTGRSDWATIAKFYPMLNRPLRGISETVVMTGPLGLPLDLTQVTVSGEEQPSPVLPAETYDLRNADGALFQVPHGQIYLFKTHDPKTLVDDALIPLGGTNNTDRIKVRGAELGDRLCVFDNRSDPALLGCVDPIKDTSSVVTLESVEDWRPNIELRPTTTDTVRITVTLDSPLDRLNVQLLPAYGPPVSATTAISSPWAAMVPAGPIPTGADGTGQDSSPSLPISDTATLAAREQKQMWVQDIVLPYPLFEGTVRVWVPDAPVLREALSPFFLSAGWGPFARGGDPTLARGLGPFARGGDPTLQRGLGPFARGGDPTLLRGLGPFARGGDPTLLRGLGPFARGGDPTLLRGLGPFARGGDPVPARGYGANNRALGAPVGSADGQVTIFNVADVMADPGTISLQALPVAPDVPSYLTPVGQAYRLIASDAVSRTISFNYLGREVPDGYEYPQTLHLYFLPEHSQKWVQLPAYVDTQENLVAGPAAESGIYALMASVDIPLVNSGWNLVSYPILETRPVTEALRSIEGTYTTVYSFDSASPTDPWKVFDVNAEAWQNDAFAMEFGRGYWINVSSPITLSLAVPQIGSGEVLTPLGQLAAGPGFEDLPNPPAVYHGPVGGVQIDPGATAVVTATIDGVPCGRGVARRIDAADPQVYYFVKVAAATPQRVAPTIDDRSKCGAPGRQVGFVVGSETVATTAPWDNSRPKELALTTAERPADTSVSTVATCREIVVNNKGFELSSGWALEPPAGAASFTPTQWHSGRRALLLSPKSAAQRGQTASPTTASASQVIPLPADAASVTVSFWYKTNSVATSGDTYRARAGVPGQSQPTTLDLGRASAWTQATIALPAPITRRMTLAFQAFNPKPSRSDPTWMAIDDVSVQICTQ